MSKESEKVKRVQKRKKLFAVERFGGKCVLCGYNKCISALHFHHLNSEEKNEKPSYIIMRWSWEKAKKELEKCILVCSNCHAELHDDIDGIKDIVTRKLIQSQWEVKKCEVCGEKFETKTDGRFCSQVCYKFSTRKVIHPSKEELEELLKEGVTWVKLGKLFGVSNVAVRKWAVKYNLI